MPYIEQDGDKAFPRDLKDDPEISDELRAAAIALYAKEQEWRKAYEIWQRALDRGSSHRTVTLYYQRMQAIQLELGPLEDRFWKVAINEDPKRGEALGQFLKESASNDRKG